MRALFEEADVDVIQQVMNTNFFGVVYATKYCLPEIIRSKGSVIGISSIAGFQGLPGSDRLFSIKICVERIFGSVKVRAFRQKALTCLQLVLASRPPTFVFKP